MAGWFGAEPAIVAKTASLARAFHAALGDAAGRFVFMGRIGERYPKQPRTRSVRHPPERT